MIPYSVLTFDTPYNRKLHQKYGDNMGYINNSVRQEHRTTQVTSKEDMLELILNKGVIQPWNTEVSNYGGSGAIFIDFDKGTSLQSALNTAKTYSVVPTIVYKTLSETYTGRSKTKITKFRFVYMFDRPIQTTEEYKATYSGLLKVFHMADRSTRNFDRWFFTGKSSEENTIIDINDICCLNDITPMITEAFVHNSKLNSNLKRSNILNNLPKNNYFIPCDIDEVNHDDILDVCSLYNDHDNHIQMGHEDKMVLLTNLRYITNGTDYFLSRLIEGKNTKSSLRWERTIEQVNRQKFSPMNCANCSKYSSCQNGKIYGNLRNTIVNRADIEPIETVKHEYYTIDECRDELKDNIEECIQDSSNTVYVMETPAAVGKTHTVLDNFLNYGVMAFPNHKLKDEKYEWTQDNNIDAWATQNLRDIVTDEQDVIKINKAYDTNNKLRVKDIIRMYPGGDEFIKRRGIPLTNSTLTTHEKTFSGQMSSDVHTIFYDEDPTSSMMLYKKWSIQKLKNDMKKLLKRKLITVQERDLVVTECSKWDEVANSSPKYLKSGSVRSQLSSIATKVTEALKKEKIILNNNLLNLLNAEVVTKDSYMTVRTFSKGRRIIVLSATPDIEGIKLIAEKSGKSVKIIKPSKQVKRLGSIKQVLINTSKVKIEDNEELLKEMSTAENVITYKSHVGTYNTDENMPYGGNTTGYNYLKGKDVDVIYTLQARPEYYKMKYALMYGKAPTSKMVNKKVKWKNSRFMFYTSRDEKLQNIIFQHIDSEMVQAIERARTLTEVCVATVYSNFVCSIVDSVNVKNVK